MEWKLVKEGGVVRCTCGFAFFEVADDSATWYIRSMVGMRLRIPGSNLLLCKNRQCQHTYLSVTRPADQANGPPIAA